jgi:hypothetical protein
MKLTDSQQVIAYTMAAYIQRTAKANNEIAVQDLLICAQELIDLLTPEDNEPDPNDPFA